MAGTQRVLCPGWASRYLSNLRRHVTCGRPLRFLPGMLNTVLDYNGERVSRLLLLPDDSIILEYTGEGDVREDKLYELELGPRYLQYRLHHYQKGRVTGSCDPLSLGEEQLITSLALQRMVVRPRYDGSLEVCGSNNTIVTDGDDIVYSISLLSTTKVEQGEGDPIEPPWFVDKTLASRLYPVRAELRVLGWEGESLVQGRLEVEAYHPEPGVEVPRIHLGVGVWNRRERHLRLYLIPLYSYLEEYGLALTLSTLLLATAAREGVPVTARSLRKNYKKLSRALEEAGLPRVEGGVPYILEHASIYGLRVEGENVWLSQNCSVCRGARPASFVGAQLLVDSLASGALLVL